jgi:ribosomal protein S18 acetylase RimI-like enzyme
MRLSYINVDSTYENQIFSLLREAAVWLNNKGIDYWQNWLNPPQKHIKWIQEGIINKEFFLVYNSNELVGMYRLLINDPIFWGNKLDKAVYIHSLTTKREYSGKGFGKLIIFDIEKEAKEKGFQFIRLDCGSDITGLCNYYESIGFQNVGICEVDGYKTKLYQKEIK